MNSTKYKKDYSIVTDEMILEKEKMFVKLKYDRKQNEHKEQEEIQQLVQKIKQLDKVLEDKIEQKALIDKDLKIHQIKMKELQKIQSFNNSIGANLSMIRP